MSDKVACPICGQELNFDLFASDFDDRIVCDECGKYWRVDWDYVGDGIAYWVSCEDGDVEERETV